MRYQHAEAYCLMTYTADDGSESEQVWNGRDGVTPFVITLRSGKTATHHNWNDDRRVPDYQPPPGSRIFVDLTPERAREVALANARRYFDDPDTGLQEAARENYGTPERLAEVLVMEYDRPGMPDLIDAPNGDPDGPTDA